MSAEACAELVRRGDPDRWRTAMLAPVAMRGDLMALYAFNLEIARAPWLVSEPMLAAIRLRWWEDAIAEIYHGSPPRRHEVVTPLARIITRAHLPRGAFEEMIAARLIDAERQPHGDRASLETYLDHTAGHLMVLAAQALGADDGALPVIRKFARGAGLAAYLRALPALRARGYEPLSEGLDITEIVGSGRQALAEARRDRARVPRAALPGLLTGWMAGARLRRACELGAIPAGRLEFSPFRERASLILRTATGRW